MFFYRKQGAAIEAVILHMTRYFAAVTFHDIGSQFQTPSSSQDCAKKWVEFSQIPPLPQVFLEAGYSHGFWSELSKNTGKWQGALLVFLLK